LDGGGLAGPVGAPQPDNLTFPDLKRHIRDGGGAVELFAEVFDLNDGLAHARGEDNIIRSFA
jgi:hypothetical protein